MCAYVQSCYQCSLFNKFIKKNKTCTLLQVKIKSYATIPLSISFPWAWEGKPLAFFKILKSAVFSNFQQISHFSSKRKARNSAPSFQFMTPEQRTHPKIEETYKIPAFPTPKETKFRLHPFHSQPRPSDLAKSEQKDMNFSTFQKMHSMTPARKARNLEHEVFFPFFHTIRTP